MTEHTISVPMPTDESGMVGRSCPDATCNRYFKLKPGTGLPTDRCHCPYCGYMGDASDLLTEDQRQYAISYATRQIVDPMMRDFGRNLRRLNTQSRGGLVSIRFDLRYEPTPIHSYVEKELETRVTCDRCSLEFSVYGVFASCPDCQRLNGLTTLRISLETARKRVRMAGEQSLDDELRRRFPRDAVWDAVSAFDAYGKALRASFPTVLRKAAKSNLFQDLDALDAELQAAGIPGLPRLADGSVDGIRWLFQARHIYEHNAGVVDHRFVSKLPGYAHLQGRLLPLPHEDILSAIDQLGQLADAIDREFHGRSE